MTTQLTTEINELRYQVRTLKRMLFGVFGLVVVGGLLAATSLQNVPDVIKAKGFEVVNDEGKVTFDIANREFGSSLIFYNKDGKPVAGLGTKSNGGVLRISNTDGITVATIYANEFGGALGVFNKDEKSVAGLVATESGGMMGISNKDGEIVGGIHVDKNEDGVVTTRNSKGEVTSQTP